MQEDIDKLKLQLKDWIGILLPIAVWSVVGSIIFTISSYYEDSNNICQIDDTNYQKDKYDSPQAESKECLKAFHNVTLMFGIGAFVLGILLSLVSFFAGQNSEQRRTPV